MSYLIEVELSKYPYWRLKSGNGRTLAHSEGYSTNTDARRAAKRLYKNIKSCSYSEVRK